MEFTLGQMEENMKVNILKIKKKGMEYSHGQMVKHTHKNKYRNNEIQMLLFQNYFQVGNMLDNGKLENSMEQEYILTVQENRKRANGKMGKESNGNYLFLSLFKRDTFNNLEEVKYVIFIVSDRNMFSFRLSKVG